MAKKAEKIYIVTVDSNPGFCGVDACGVQFSHGQAETSDTRAVAWFEEHDGYSVKEKTAQASAEKEKTAQAAAET